ncbi:MAG TPA: hypothetical protein VFI09_06290 [Solirubrobacterales bacterium]|nr:hypothetical protein [Solirubrobacterales bacterium]
MTEEEIEMGWGARLRFVFVVGVLAAGLAVGAPMALADTGDIVAPSDPENPQVDSGWQAGTCTAEPPTSTNFCSVATPNQFFEQAAGHPQWGFTQIIVKNEPPGKTPVGELKTVRVDLPVGLSVNPQATPQCEQATFESSPSSCPAGSAVGKSEVTASVPPLGIESPPIEPTVYNIDPPVGEPARFGFELVGNFIYLKANVAWDGDFHEGFTIEVPAALPEALGEFLGLLTGEHGLILKNRLVFNGRSGNGTFITTPSTCLGPAVPSSPFVHLYSTWLRADSYAEPNPTFPEGSTFFESRIPPNTEPKECGSIPFDPSIDVDPNTAQTDSPSGPSVAVDVPFEPPTGAEIAQEKTKQAQSYVREAKVTLPSGMGLNPSAASGGLQTCTNAEFGLRTHNESNGCPAGSRIGSVSIDTPPLPDGSLTGSVYVGQQLSRDPTSGQEYRIFVEALSQRYGIFVRLEGKVSADPVTGQLTTTFEGREVEGIGGTKIPKGLPQVPFSSFVLDFNDGEHAVLTSPGACGPNKTTTAMTPWSGNPAATPSGDFTLTAAPGGGACAKTLADRPFAPSFGAGTAKDQAGAYSPLHMDIGRSDGNQELKGVDVTLPPGLSAKLKGVQYCPDAALAAAANVSGSDEAAHSSCPDASLIGQAEVAAGSGPAPIHIQGKVFLAGPYEGAPLSLAVVTPATAGPFDLGTVVVRVALHVDPRTAQVQAQSDSIPHVYGGATLDIRSVAVKLDRHEFSLNPTSCSPGGFGGWLFGGGANPNDPAVFSRAPASAAFSTSGCEKLGFKPKIFFRLFGATRRAKNPKLRVVLLPHAGDANFARAATILPPSLILDQANLSKVCTRVQYAAHNCPKKSIYGHARAFSPLLEKPLEGPVYLRSSDNTLPDLVAALHGQVDIELDSRTDSVHGRIRNTFDTTPDVPVSKLIFILRGGRKGLLVNSRNQCPRKRVHKKGSGDGKRVMSSAQRHGKGHKGKKKRKGQRVMVRFKAQNGKKLNLRPRLRAPCRKHRAGHHRSHKQH